MDVQWRLLLIALLLAALQRLAPPTTDPAAARPEPERYATPALAEVNPARLDLPAVGSLRWRVGVGVSEASVLAFAWPDPRPGWFHNWDTGLVEPDGAWLPMNTRRLAPAGRERRLGMEYAATLRTRNGRLYLSETEISEYARSFQGRAWIIGNEPDVEPQDWATPTEYATAYHTAYTAIKRGDPAAKVVAGNIGQVTAVRLQYLDAVLAAYRTQYNRLMPVDVWGIHVFVLNEGEGEWGIGLPPGLPLEAGAGQRRTIDEHDNVSLIAEQVRLMRRWMVDRGYGNQPLWITEYGILLPPELGFTPERTAAFLEASFDLFQTLRDPVLGLNNDEDRLIQRWIWFSTRSDEFPTGNLFDANGQPTLVLEAMQNFLNLHQ